MDKIAFYNGVIELYKKTGQGFPAIFKFKAEDAINELIADGLLKIVKMPSINDEFVCLTGVYCVEEDKLGMKALSFMRMYLGIEDDMAVPFIRKDKKLMTEYEAWLKKNKKDIDKVHTLKPVESSEYPELDAESLKYLKKRTWYKKNESVAMAMDKAIEITHINNQLISLSQQLIRACESKGILMTTDDRYSVAEATTNIANSVKENKILDYIIKWMGDKDQDAGLKTLI